MPSGTFTPALALANFSQSPRTVKVSYALTQNGTASPETVETVTLAPSSSREVKLHGLAGDPMLQDSLLVASDGSPGDVLTKLVSKSEDSVLHEAEVFGKDLETPANAGEHPWTVENGTTSTQLLYNQSDTQQWFNVQISAGKTVWSKSYQLQPQQTEAVVINDLIKTGAKDNHGVAFPSDIWSGQAGWSVPQKNAGQGRLMQSNRDRAMARNFSCSNTVQVCQAAIDNADSFFLLGQTVDFGQINFGVCYQSCSGTPVGNGELGYSYSWDTENSNVASISGSSQNQTVNLYGAGIGGTMIDAYVSDFYCSIQASPPAPATVTPVLSSSKSLWFLGPGIAAPANWPLGSTQSVITASGASGGNFNWSITGGILSFSSSSQQSSTTTSGNSVTVYSIGASTSADDVTVNLSWYPSGGGSAIPADLDLQVDSPYELIPTTNSYYGVQTSCNPPDSGTAGFSSFIGYSIMSYFGVAISNIPVNEQFGSMAYDYSGTNWPAFTAGSFTPTSSTFADIICLAFPTGTPPTLPPQRPLGTLTVEHAAQAWRIGSTTSGQGILVQTDTHQKYQDHGANLDPVSPP